MKWWSNPARLGFFETWTFGECNRVQGTEWTQGIVKNENYWEVWIDGVDIFRAASLHEAQNAYLVEIIKQRIMA